MNGRTTQRFGLRFGKTVIPSVEITVAEHMGRILPAGSSVRQVVVARRFGFTASHAYIRALRWAERHGDPR